MGVPFALVGGVLKVPLLEMLGADLPARVQAPGAVPPEQARYLALAAALHPDGAPETQHNIQISINQHFLNSYINSENLGQLQEKPPLQVSYYS